MDDQHNKIIHIDNKAGVMRGNDDIVEPHKINHNNGGGEPPMDKDRYVTQKDLDLHTEKMLRHMDQRFDEMDKQLNKMELEIHDVKNTANNNKEKINWVLYTALGGIVISVITTIISNLLTK